MSCLRSPLFVLFAAFVVGCVPPPAEPDQKEKGANAPEARGQLVGKWRVVALPGDNEALKTLTGDDGFLYVEFAADGTATFGLCSQGSFSPLSSGKYRLAGERHVDLVGLDGLLDPKTKDDEAERKTVRFTGADLTLSGANGTIQLTKIK